MMAAYLLKMGRLGSLKALQTECLNALQKAPAVALSSKSGEGKKSKKSNKEKSTSKTYFDIEKFVQHKSYPEVSKNVLTPASAAAATTASAIAAAQTDEAIPATGANKMAPAAETCVVETTPIVETGAVQPAVEASPEACTLEAPPTAAAASPVAETAPVVEVPIVDSTAKATPTAEATPETVCPVSEEIPSEVTTQATTSAISPNVTPEVLPETTNTAVTSESSVIEVPTDIVPDIAAKADSLEVASKITAETTPTESAAKSLTDDSLITESVLEVLEAAAEVVTEVVAETVPVKAVAEVVEAIAETVAEVIIEAAPADMHTSDVITDATLPSVKMDAPEVGLDPIQKLFLDSIRSYCSKSGEASGLVDAGPEYHKTLTEEISKLQRLYGGGDLESFPEFNFSEPKLDEVSTK